MGPGASLGPEGLPDASSAPPQPLVDAGSSPSALSAAAGFTSGKPLLLASSAAAGSGAIVGTGDASAPQPAGPGGGAPPPAPPGPADGSAELSLASLPEQYPQQEPQQQQPPQQDAAAGPEALRPLRLLQPARSLSGKRRPEVWGWLQPAPGCTKLPFVLLQGQGVALGRGRDAYHERLPQLMLRASSLATALSSGASGAAAEPPPAVSPRGSSNLSSSASGGGASGSRDASFVEVADGRISRLHAWVRWDAAVQQAVLEVRWWRRRAGGCPVGVLASGLHLAAGRLAGRQERHALVGAVLPQNNIVGCTRAPAAPQDLSSNGTFLNGRRLGRGRSAPLADGDRIALVLSVAPLAEQAFTYCRGGWAAGC